jgi:hypothetical protein
LRRARNLTQRWLAGALLTCASQAWALGAEVPYASFATSAEVDWIKVCGEWPVPTKTGEGHGAYRIVHATRQGQSFVYLQWIVRDGNDSASEVHTHSFDLINNDHAEITLSQMNCQPTRRGIRFTARAQSGHDDSVFRITVDAGHRPGEVRVRTQPKR